MQNELSQKEQRLKRLETQIVSKAEVIVKKKEPSDEKRSTFGPNSKEDWPDHNIAIKALYNNEPEKAKAKKKGKKKGRNTQQTQTHESNDSLADVREK